MDRGAFDARVARLEVFAREHPAAYRWSLIALALLGYAYLLVLLLGIAAATLFIFLLVLRGGGILALKVGIPLLVLAGIVLRAMWVRFDRPNGRPVYRTEAPRLYAMLDELRRSLGTPPFNHVLVSNDFNAFVSEVPRLGVFGWPSHWLVLGMPLMHALSPQQFRAVLAHELGHRSGRHGRLGAWLYRVRAAWSRLLVELEQRRHKAAFAFTTFFRWYAPLFEAWSFVMARRQEYEADRQAAALTSPADLGGALVNIQVNAQYYEGDLWPAVDRIAGRELEPPAGVNRDFALRLRQGPPPDVSARYLVASLARATDTTDTHPSLTDRLAAIGVSAPAPGPLPALAATAADELLGDLAARILADFDAQWRAAVGPAWRDRHRQVAAARGRFAELGAAAIARDLSVDEQCERAFLADQLEEPEAAFAPIAAGAAAAPDDAELRFVYGRALLARGDESGVAQVESAMMQDPRLILAGCDLLIGHYLARGDRDAAQGYRGQALAEHELRFKAAAERRGFAPSDEVAPHGLPPEGVGALRMVFAMEPDVAAAYVARKAVKHIPEEPYFVVAVDVRFPWYRFRNEASLQQLLDRLSGSVVLPGPSWIVAAQNGRDGVVKRLKRATPSALIYRR